MSVLGIASSLFSNFSTQYVQNGKQQFQQDFQQLGQDLQSGNLSAAQSDFATLQQLNPQIGAASTSTTQTNNPISQEFTQLSQDLQSGNLSAAQQDFTTIQQDFQNHQAGRHHHSHSGGGQNGQSAVTQLFSQLGQELQSGNLSTAQQTYNTLLQDFQQFSQGGTTSTGGSSSASSNSGSTLSVTA